MNEKDFTPGRTEARHDARENALFRPRFALSDRKSERNPFIANDLKKNIL
jgi:hypothetical protein